MKEYKIGCCVMSMLTAAIAVAQGQEQEQASMSARERVWRVEVGWVHQWGRGMSVRGPAPSLHRALLPYGRGTRWTGQLPPDAMTGPAMGIPDASVWNYDDGYVFPDEESAVRPGGNLANPYATHYWHYENRSQYDSVNETLTFHRSLGMRADGSQTMRGDTSDEDMPRDGLNISASRWLYTWPAWNIDIDLTGGLSWFPNTDTMESNRSVRQRVVTETETYVYQDYFGSPQGGEWQPSLDYYASFYGGFHSNNDPPGDNPLIPLENLMSRESLSGVITDDVRIKGKIWRLRGELGPTLSRSVTQRLSVYLAPQLVIEWIDVRVSRTETATLHANGQTRSITRSNKGGTTRVEPGLLLSTGARYMVSANWHVGASLGWEWLARDVKVKAGPDTARFDLDGGEFKLYAGREF